MSWLALRFEFLNAVIYGFRSHLAPDDTNCIEGVEVHGAKFNTKGIRATNRSQHGNSCAYELGGGLRQEVRRVHTVLEINLPHCAESNFHATRIFTFRV